MFISNQDYGWLKAGFNHMLIGALNALALHSVDQSGIEEKLRANADD